jgi:nitrous oxide reductase accessory protein NosL
MVRNSVLLFIFLTFSLHAYPDYSTALKEKKIYPMGAKIYAKKCKDDVDVHNYSRYKVLYSAIKDYHICGKLNEKYSEALALYLWDNVRTQHKHYEKLTVTKEDKCPVCGMFLYKYPKWVSRLYYGKKAFSFDGVKDMMKYYFTQEKMPSLILVQDYYTAKTIDATKAYYVVGSDVYGPMGNELIAFKTKESAQKFLLDHKGKKILRFDEITPQLVMKLDT